MASKKVTQVAQAKVFEISQYAWSPDSKWIAYAQPEPEFIHKIHLYSVEQNKDFEATDGWYQPLRLAIEATGGMDLETAETEALGKMEKGHLAALGGLPNGATSRIP